MKEARMSKHVGEQLIGSEISCLNSPQRYIFCYIGNNLLRNENDHVNDNQISNNRGRSSEHSGIVLFIVG